MPASCGGAAASQCSHFFGNLLSKSVRLSADEESRLKADHLDSADRRMLVAEEALQIGCLKVRRQTGFGRRLCLLRLLCNGLQCKYILLNQQSYVSKLQ